MVKIQVCSNLNIKSYKDLILLKENNTKSDILIIPGNIVINMNNYRYIKFLNLINNNYKKSIIIMGISEYYNNGIDVVIARSKVINYKDISAIYQSCYENFNYNNKNYKPKWSEGFSARKDCLISVGLYPNLGVDGGNDNLLSEKLEKKFKVKRDFNIIMHHRAPDNIKEFFNQQIQRGSAGPQFDLLYYKKRKEIVIFKYLIKMNILIFNFITQLFFLFKSLTFFYHAENKRFYTFFKIWLSLNLRYIFHTLGEIKVLLK